MKTGLTPPKQQSPHWAERENVNHRVDRGYPFKEDLPRSYFGKKYTLILMNGEHHIAVVDDSCQYRAEGIQ